jgi:hypothetical protein
LRFGKTPSLPLAVTTRARADDCVCCAVLCCADTTTVQDSKRGSNPSHGTPSFLPASCACRSSLAGEWLVIWLVLTGGHTYDLAIYTANPYVPVTQTIYQTARPVTYPASESTYHATPITRTTNSLHPSNYLPRPHKQASKPSDPDARLPCNGRTVPIIL